jgi:hypothetical protein
MEIITAMYGELIDEAGEWLIAAIVIYWIGKLFHLWFQTILSK